MLRWPRSLRLGFAVLAFSAIGCLKGSSRSTSDGGTLDAATPNDSDGGGDAQTSDAGADAAEASGLTVSAATNTALNGSYAIQLYRLTNAAEIAFNGAFPDAPGPGAGGKPRIEMEVVVDGTSGAVKRAHFWNYDASGSNVDKTYGCDGSTDLPCTGVTVDLTTNLVSLATVTWKEVTPDLAGLGPDTVVAGGGSVTLTGKLTAKVM